MILYLSGHDFHYEMENLCRVFFPMEEIRCTKEPAEGARVISAVLSMQNAQAVITVYAQVDGKSAYQVRQIGTDGEAREKEYELCMAQALFNALQEITGYTPAWGILTGVRPAKLMHRLVEEEGSAEAAKVYFHEKLMVSEKKTELALKVAQAQTPVYRLSRPESYSLYVSIPFCPTRCSYCSFVSHSMNTAKKLMPEYVRLLSHELAGIGKTAKELGLRLETIYFGGGTPTTLSAEDFLFLDQTIHDNFDLSFLREYTVEAGRPDTVTPEKLTAMKQAGVDRISINPQTLNDAVLEHIGRRHTAQQALDAYAMARTHGFDNINMDLIAGLPMDTLESYHHTLETVLALEPESITVHTLALKRSSSLVTQGEETVEMSARLTGKMLDETADSLPAKGYYPYYMYRQSRCVGNLENVGWCLAGKESLYNVFMMDEIHTVLAAGAGAVTKLKAPQGPYLERVFNFKYPYEYISRFDELMERKNKIPAFYEKYR